MSTNIELILQSKSQKELLLKAFEHELKSIQKDVMAKAEKEMRERANKVIGNLALSIFQQYDVMKAADRVRIEVRCSE